MQKIINGKKYDTETAEKLGTHCYYFGEYRDETFTIESLYLKDNGEFFLYGTSGSMGKYPKDSLFERVSGEIIKPFTQEEAKQWTECLCGKTYQDIFGFVEE